MWDLEFLLIFHNFKVNFQFYPFYCLPNIIINILIDRRLSTYRDVKSLMKEEIEGSYPKLYRKIYFKNIIDINKITSKPNFFYKSPDLSNNYIISISLITLLVLRIIF